MGAQRSRRVEKVERTVFMLVEIEKMGVERL